MHAYLVLVNCAVVTKWEGSVDDKQLKTVVANT